MKTTEIPADRSSIGGFYIADQEREKNTRALFDEILKSNPTQRHRRAGSPIITRPISTPTRSTAPACAGQGGPRRDRAHRRQAAAERGDRKHAPRRHRPAQRDQFPHRKSVRDLRHPGAGDAGRAAALSDAGRASACPSANIICPPTPRWRTSATKYPRLCRDRSCRLAGLSRRRKARRSGSWTSRPRSRRRTSRARRARTTRRRAGLDPRRAREESAGDRLGRAARCGAARHRRRSSTLIIPTRSRSSPRWSARSRCRAGRTGWPSTP